MIQQKSFLDSLPITAAAFGRKFGVDVAFGGEVAKTNGNTIFLPEIGSDVEENEVLAWLGHECGHILATNFKELQRGYANDDIKRLPVVRTLANALEDPRVELEIGKEFGGMRCILSRFYAAFITKLLASIKRNGTGRVKPELALTSYVLFKGEHLLFKEPCFEKAMTIFRPIVVTGFTEAGAAIVDDEVSHMAEFKSTRDCMDCAKRIYQRLMALREDLKQQVLDDCKKYDTDLFAAEETQEQKQGQPSSGSDKSESKKSAESKAKASPNGERSGNQNTEPSQGEASAESGKEGEASDEGKETQSERKGQAGSSGSSGSPSAGSSDRPNLQTATEAILVLDNLDTTDESVFSDQPGLSETVQRKLTRSAKRQNRKCCRIRKPRSARPLIPPRPRPQAIRIGEENFVERTGLDLIAKAKMHSRELRKAMRHFVETNTRRRGWTATTGTRLAASQLARIAVHDPKVFDRRVEKRGIDTAVHILVDYSGSMKMSETKEESNGALAMQAALALFIGFAAIPKVNPAISVFQGNGLTNVVPHGAKRTEPYAGVIGQQIYMGGTPLDVGVIDADALLKRTRSKRRIQIVITDGVPDNPSSADDAIQALLRKGTEFFAIGIGRTAQVDMFFSNYRRILSIEELPDALFEGAKMLIGEGFRR